MPTCENCGHKESGRYFKDKICPNCKESQFPTMITSRNSKPILESEESLIGDTLDNVEKETNSYSGILGNSHKVEEIKESEESYSIPTMETFDRLEKLEESEDFDKITLTSSEWKVLTIEIYVTVESMLKNLNPEFYSSQTAQNLRNLNAKLSAIVLSAKKVNPMRILLLTNFLYILPAIRGLGKKKEEKEIIPEKPKRREPTKKEIEQNPNTVFYKS